MPPHPNKFWRDLSLCMAQSMALSLHPRKALLHVYIMPHSLDGRIAPYHLDLRLSSLSPHAANVVGLVRESSFEIYKSISLAVDRAEPEPLHSQKVVSHVSTEDAPLSSHDHIALLGTLKSFGIPTSFLSDLQRIVEKHA